MRIMVGEVVKGVEDEWVVVDDGERWLRVNLLGDMGWKIGDVVYMFVWVYVGGVMGRVFGRVIKSK